MKIVNCFILITFGLFLSTGCVPKNRHIRVTSEPLGAEVYYQNKLLGTTPLETEIQQQVGDHNVYIFKATKDGYKPNQQFFKEEFYHDTVTEIVPESMHFVLVERKRFPIQITSEPSDATLFFNGKIIGKTPKTVIVLENIGMPRRFDFRVEKEGYNSKSRILKEYVPEKDEKPFEFPESIHFEL